MIEAPLCACTIVNFFKQIYAAFVGTAGASLPLCSAWPDVAYYLTNKVFTCSGNITKVHICPLGWPEITVRTLQRVSTGLMVDTGVSRAFLEGDGNMAMLEPPLLYRPGDHLGLEVYGQCDLDEGCKHHRYLKY